MTLRSITILLLCVSLAGADGDRSIERNLSTLANVIIPVVDFTDGTTVSEGIEFLNIVLRSPDPPPPKEWKIRTELSDKAMNTKLAIRGRDMNLHKILGQIADTIGAEIVVTRKGYVLREPKTKRQNKAAHANPLPAPSRKLNENHKP